MEVQAPGSKFYESGESEKISGSRILHFVQTAWLLNA